jgi:hypothetical protein
MSVLRRAPHRHPSGPLHHCSGEEGPLGCRTDLRRQRHQLPGVGGLVVPARTHGATWGAARVLGQSCTCMCWRDAWGSGLGQCAARSEPAHSLHCAAPLCVELKWVSSAVFRGPLSRAAAQAPQSAVHGNAGLEPQSPPQVPQRRQATPRSGDEPAGAAAGARTSPHCLHARWRSCRPRRTAARRRRPRRRRRALQTTQSC